MSVYKSPGGINIAKNQYIKFHQDFQDEHKISCAILAGGKNIRMNGHNKAFLTTQNQTFVERLIGELKDFDEIMISCANQEDYKKFNLKLVEDEIKDIGPLGGIYSCLKQARNEHLFICAVDMPGIKKELVQFMTQFISSDYDAYLIKTATKLEPVCAIYRKTLLPAMENSIKNKKYVILNPLDQGNVKYISLKYSCFSDDIVSNINTRDELTKYNDTHI